MAGELGGFLGSARALLEATIGCPRSSLQALKDFGRVWDDLGLGWGVGGVGFRSVLRPVVTYTQGLPIPKVIRATSQQVNIYIYMYIYTHIY